MKYILLLLIPLFQSIALAHEIEGSLSFNGKLLAKLPRTPISVASSSKTETGRIYVLWLAPDGAIAFHVDSKLAKLKKSPVTKVWMIQAKKPVVLPEGFEVAAIDKKGEVNGVETMLGATRVHWVNDLDYTIYMDAKGVGGKHAFKGHLYGGKHNKKIK